MLLDMVEVRSVNNNVNNTHRHTLIVCKYGHTFSKNMDHPSKATNLDHGQLNRENVYVPVHVVL